LHAPFIEVKITKKVAVFKAETSRNQQHYINNIGKWIVFFLSEVYTFLKLDFSSAYTSRI
jgi:hypothetical protein